MQLLQIDESILSVTLVDMKGIIFLSKNKYHFNNDFVSNDTSENWCIWVRIAISIQSIPLSLSVAIVGSRRDPG